MKNSKTFKISKEAARFFDEMLKRKAENKKKVSQRFEQGELTTE
ncbi:MAG: hypothetical protein WBG46_01915 [Nonlabens sp.]